MAEIDWEERTGHPQECSCGYCTVVKKECNGKGHDWLPQEEDSDALYCTQCASTAYRLQRKTRDGKWAGPTVVIDA